jgi:hypothetical protein
MASDGKEPEKQKPFVSRPLRTGGAFTIVLAAQRAVAAQWDKVEYDPGGACQLSLTGKGLGEDPLEFVVEVEQDGVWNPIARVSAPVDGEGKKAEATWTAPPKPVAKGSSSMVDPDGSCLTDPRFENHADLEGDGPVWMCAKATGFEGQALQVVLEREKEPGTWVSVGEAVGTVKSGALRTSVLPERDG